MPKRPVNFIPGLILVLLGIWFLARNLDVRVPGLDQLWPIFPLLFGLSFIVQFFANGRHEEGLLFAGTAATLVGAFFFAITLGPLTWTNDYWPVFPLIGGVAFLAQWLARPSQRGLLVPAMMGILVGVVGLAVTLNLIGPDAAKLVGNLWPVLLILAGLAMLGRYFFPGSVKKE